MHQKGHPLIVKPPPIFYYSAGLRGVLLLLTISFLSGCREKSMVNIKQLVTTWQDKEMIFPDSLVFLRYAIDTVAYDFMDADFKVMVYNDSTDCNSCSFKLPQWKSFICEVDSLSDKKVAFLFFMRPKMGFEREVYYLLREQSFTHPVIFDHKRHFKSLNLIPDDTRFQTFLLNRQNRVVCLGSPILNHRIKELYLSIIKGEALVVEEKQTLTMVEYSEELLLGEIKLGGKKNFSLKLKNTGDVPLVISQMITTCGCVDVTIHQEPIAAADSVVLQGLFLADKIGLFIKTVSLYCNISDSPLNIKLKGEVKK